MAKQAKNGNGKEPRRFSFSLSWAGLAGLATVALIGLVWVFVLGVLVGRGYRPENTVPELARIMPKAAPEQPAAEPEVLRPEDLQFFDKLKEQAAPPEPRPEPKPEPKPAPAPEPATAPEPERPAAQQDEAGDHVFDYVYQVASFREEAMARAFRSRVEALGLAAAIQAVEFQGEQWHRVNVHFRGRPEDTRAMKDKLRTLGVEKPLLRAKEPV
jgi:cell division protein FtsN